MSLDLNVFLRGKEELDNHCYFVVSVTYLHVRCVHLILNHKQLKQLETVKQVQSVEQVSVIIFDKRNSGLKQKYSVTAIFIAIVGK